jgi:phage baseplate assembly protein W
MAQDFIGAGWAFPLRTDATGRIALVSGDREIQESMRLILGTAPGERPMRPEFGCGIHNYVFAGMDATTAVMMELEVRTSLERWEPRIEVEDVVITADPAEASRLYVDVTYTVSGTNDPRNLVFPFYTIPAEG